MQSIKRLLVTAFTAVLCLAVFAGTMCILPSSYAFAAADDEYTYVVTINSGKEGDFTDGKVNSTGLIVRYGDEVTVDVNGNISVNGTKVVDSTLTVKDGNTYYPRGIKLAGHDNDETVSKGYATSYNFTATEDESFSVAYGMKGGMVKYVVNYVDEDGNPVHDSGTFYGMPGDYPVVSYQYVEGYLPDAYNKGKTLVADESQNVFTFTYTRTLGEADNGDNQGGQNGAANAGGNGNAGGRLGGNNGNANGPANFQNLDDGAVPLGGNTGNNGNDNGGNGAGNGNGGNGSTTVPDNPTPAGLLGRNPIPFIIGGGLLAALIALIAFLRMRGYEYVDDDEEDDDEDESGKSAPPRELGYQHQQQQQ